jgi:hypothetical protein
MAKKKKFSGWDGLEAEVKNNRLKLNKETGNITVDRMNGLKAENKNGRLYLYANPEDMDAMIPGSTEAKKRVQNARLTLKKAFQQSRRTR